MDGPSCLTEWRTALYSGGMEKVSFTHLPESEDIFQIIYSSSTWWERLFFPKNVAKRAAHKIQVDVVLALAVEAAQERSDHDQKYRLLLNLRDRETEKRRVLSLVVLDLKRAVSAHLNMPDADDRAFISNLEVDLTGRKYA